MKTFLNILLLLVPRFITDRVAVEMGADGTYYPVCSMSGLQPGDRFDGVITLNVFTWLGVCIPAPWVGDRQMQIDPWPDNLEGGDQRG